MNILEGDDALITGSDLIEAGKVAVSIALPDDAQVNDTLTVNGVITPITKEMIDNGFVTSVDVPAQGTTLFVKAVVTYQNGTQSGTGKDFARVGDTEAPILNVNQVVVNGLDENGDGKPDNTAITGTTEAGAIVGVDTNGDGRSDFVTVADSLGNFELTIKPALDKNQEVKVTATDAAGNTSKPQAVIGLGDTIAPSAPIISAPKANGINGTYSDDDLNADSTVTVIVEAPDNAQIGDTLIVNGQEITLTRKMLFTGYSLDVEPGSRVTASIKDKAGNASSTAIANISVSSASPTDAPIITDNVANDGSGAELISAEIIADFGITNDNTPGVIVPADQMSKGTPQLVVDGKVVPSTFTPNGDGSITLVPVNTLTDGNHDLSYNIKDTSNNVSGNAPAVTVIVDTIAPGGGANAAQVVPIVAIAEAANGVNATEFVNGVQAQVTLPTGTLAGDTVILTVTPDNGTAITVEYKVTADDLNSALGNGIAEVTIPNGVTGISENGDYSVTATVKDAAGNVSDASNTFRFNLNKDFIAQNDTSTLDLGELKVNQNEPINGSDLNVLGVTEGTGGSGSRLNFTVSEGASGLVNITVKQTALVTVADAVNIEVYDGSGLLVYVGTTGNEPLVGNVIGLELLGLTGNDTITATVSNLKPDNYTVVVRNDRSALEALVNDLTLTKLGDAGVVLGPDNQAVVLDAVENALNAQFPPVALLPSVNLGSVVRGILESALNVTDVLGVGDIVNALQGGLTGPVLNLVLGGVISPVLDAVAKALLSNTLTLLKTTDITATLTEFDYANDIVVSGNVIDPNASDTNEPGEDTVTADTRLTAVTSKNNAALAPTSTTVEGIEVFTIEGKYGSLIIKGNGDYTYKANGDYTSPGQSETFTYTISDGITTDTAELVINLGATIDTTPPNAPVINSPIAGDDIVNGIEAKAGFNVTGTGNFGDTITLTDEANNVIGTAIVDATGNWSVTVDKADVTKMGEGAEQLTATATDPSGNSSIKATVDISVDTIAPIASNDQRSAEVEVTSTTSTAGLNGRFSSVLAVGALNDAVGVGVLESSKVFAVNLLAGSTQTITVDGSGSQLLSLSTLLGGNNDFNLEIYRQETGSDKAELVQLKTGFLDYYPGIFGGWTANELQLDTFTGGSNGARYFVVATNPAANDGLVSLGALANIRITTTASTRTDYNVTASTISGNVITNDDGGGQSLVVTSINSDPVNASTSIVGDYGTLVIGSNGAYTYTPFKKTNVVGQTDEFEYTIDDGNGNTDTATLTIGITSEGSNPSPAAGRSIMLNDSFMLADDDAIELPDISLATSSEGFNILSFEGADQIISLSDLIQPDIIDISGIGSNTLNIAAEDVDFALYVRGDNDDTVNLEGDSWSTVGQTTSGGDVYDVWQSINDTSTQIYIDTTVHVI